MITPPTAAHLVAAVARDLHPFADLDADADLTVGPLLSLARNARWLADLADAEINRRNVLTQIAEQSRIVREGVQRERPLARTRAKALSGNLTEVEQTIRGLMEDRPAY